MTVSIEHTEIFDQSHQMYAEGTGISFGHKFKPVEKDICALLGARGWVADNVSIFFDEFQQIWRWSCDIKKSATFFKKTD